MREENSVVTVFENCTKCLIFGIFCPFKSDLSGNTVCKLRFSMLSETFSEIFKHCVFAYYAFICRVVSDRKKASNLKLIGYVVFFFHEPNHTVPKSWARANRKILN